MKNLNFYKLGFSIIYIIACLSISMSAYYKQNFKDYAKILISYSQFQFEAHSKVKKLFRDKDFYTEWKNEYEWAGDIYPFIKVGEFDLKKGYVKNNTVNITRLENIEEPATACMWFKTKTQEISLVFLAWYRQWEHPKIIKQQCTNGVDGEVERLESFQ